MGDRYDVLFKVILVGDMNVGKTSIVKRFKDGEFSEHLKNTIGVDFCVQTLCVEDKIVKVSYQWRGLFSVYVKLFTSALKD